MIIFVNTCVAWWLWLVICERVVCLFFDCSELLFVSLMQQCL
jgi:hypothetical protein